ncbi:hypothetical protein [Cohnella hashimotonis]|uniref:CBM-cenC domain-containing protein n=1 Tax=Cohnella hashimotonis TaxID=2826895 RepID=A0ABT6TM55_9BACL|nr:hypothetical protein [Cohnella hashimotonis]MDI4647019.1 hypothetical protein [Cohnella hashimotonis]
MGKRLLKRTIVLALLVASFLSLAVNVKPAEAVSTEGALDITALNNLVSINYSLWFDPVVPAGGGATNDVQRILTDSGINKTAPAWGPLYSFHYWAQPALGYYRSDNAAVIRQHLIQLEEAGVDFINIDNTNARSTWDSAYYEDIFVHPATVLLDTMKAMRQEGLRTPHVVFWTASWSDDPNPAFSGTDIYNRFYAGGQYDDLFVRYEGKPLMLVTDAAPSALTAHFTLRKMWGLQTSLANKEWSFLQPHPQPVGMNGTQKEQLSVSTAFQQSYMSDFETATPRRGGITFAAQWKRAFAERPKIVTLTWWNEWIAQRFEDSAGKTRFVDNFTYEYSRDIEPVEGGHGDAYYQFMKRYIADYKANKPFPLGLVEPTVDLGNFETGQEGWKAGANVAQAAQSYSQAGPNVPAAFDQWRLLEIQGAAVNGDQWRGVYREFERPVDGGEYRQLGVALNHWSGAPGATGYEAQISLTAENGQTLSQIFPTTGNGWQLLRLDIGSWPYRDQVRRIDIRFRAVGGNQPWAGKFFIDQVQLLKAEYNLGDFEFGTEGWTGGSHVSAVSAVTGGDSTTPAPYSGAKLLGVQGDAANGAVPRRITKLFAASQNWSSFSSFKVALSGWAGAPGAIGYTARITLTSESGATLSRPFAIPNPSGWQELTLGFSSWSYKHAVSRIDIDYIAVGGNQPWAGKFFIDAARLSKV